MIKNKDNVFTFALSNHKKVEVYFADDDHIEIYEIDDPGRTGFIFENKKDFFSFINNITDVAKYSQGDQDG